MDLITPLAGLSQAITIARAVRDADKAYDRAVLRGEMADVLDKLSDAKLALTEARDELRAKDDEIARLKAAFGESGLLAEGEGGYKYRTDEHGHKVGYPMCAKCEAVSGRIVQLKQSGGPLSAKCPVCETTVLPAPCYVPVEGGQGETETIGVRRARNEAQQRRNIRPTRTGWNG